MKKEPNPNFDLIISKDMSYKLNVIHIRLITNIDLY